jgi:hypothetical protein
MMNAETKMVMLNMKRKTRNDDSRITHHASRGNFFRFPLSAFRF